MQLSAITQPLSTELRKTETAIRKAGKDQRSPAPDRSEFSKEARQLSDTKASTAALSASIEAQPDVRLDKIAEVQEKISRGYYNSKEFTDTLADKLLSEIGLTPPTV